MDHEEDKSKSIDQHQTISKRHKPTPKDEVSTEVWENIHNLLSNQQEARKVHINNLMGCIEDLVKQHEVDYNAMIENEEKLQHLTVSYMTFIRQSITAAKNNMETLKKIGTILRKGSEELESKESAKIYDELQNNIKKLQEKLNANSRAENKRKNAELLRQLYYMINNNNN